AIGWCERRASHRPAVASAMPIKGGSIGKSDCGPAAQPADRDGTISTNANAQPSAIMRPSRTDACPSNNEANQAVFGISPSLLITPPLSSMRPRALPVLPAGHSLATARYEPADARQPALIIRRVIS